MYTNSIIWGIGDPVPVSAASRLGIGDMLDAVIAHFPEHEAEEKEDERPRVAIVGNQCRKIFNHQQTDRKAACDRIRYSRNN